MTRYSEGWSPENLVTRIDQRIEKVGIALTRFAAAEDTGGWLRRKVAAIRLENAEESLHAARVWAGEICLEWNSGWEFIGHVSRKELTNLGVQSANYPIKLYGEE